MDLLGIEAEPLVPCRSPTGLTDLLSVLGPAMSTGCSHQRPASARLVDV